MVARLPLLLLLPAFAAALTTTATAGPRLSTNPASSRRSFHVRAVESEDPTAKSAKCTKQPELVAVNRAPMQLFGMATPQLLLATIMFSCTLVFTKAQVAAAAAPAAAAATLTFKEIMAKAGKKALGGGLSGLIAGVIQVVTLMWLRTTMNYQYRYGTGTREAMATLYKQGGFGRFYQGLPYALMQAPLSRFGDTAANTGVLAIFAVTNPNMPIGLRTAVASMAGSLWRILITPVDTLKTTLQVQGKEAMGQLKTKVANEGVMVLYQGAIANALASFVGSYPWYFVFNALQESIPMAPAGVIWLKLLRNALCGFGATCVSDCVSNVIRVLKTTVQTAETSISYTEAAKQVIEKEGVLGLVTRGLGTRLMTNGIQASLFSVVWKVLEEQFQKQGL
jgi:hypothetical protein